MNMCMMRMSGLNRLWGLAASQVTEAGRGSAECLIVVRDSEPDLDTSIKCVMVSPVKVVPGEMF